MRNILILDIIIIYFFDGSRRGLNLKQYLSVIGWVAKKEEIKRAQGMPFALPYSHVQLYY